MNVNRHLEHWVYRQVSGLVKTLQKIKTKLAVISSNYMQSLTYIIP